VAELKHEPFALIGVNSDQTVARARQAVLENQLNWRSFQNQPEGQQVAIATDWAVQGWPTLVVLDRELKIRYRGHDGEAAAKVAKELLAAK
jgi:hypothetical protein